MAAMSGTYAPKAFYAGSCWKHKRGTPRGRPCQPSAAALQPATEVAQTRRHALVGGAAALAAGLLVPGRACAADLGAATETDKVLCDAACLERVGGLPEQVTASGLRFRDIVVGKGPSPPTGYQVVVAYVAMTPGGKVFDSSLTRGAPYDVRVGAGQIVAGLDEGLLTMKPGGLRRMYIPGALAFPKGLASGPGRRAAPLLPCPTISSLLRPRVPPKTPVVFDVQLRYIPGLDDDE